MRATRSRLGGPALIDQRVDEIADGLIVTAQKLAPPFHQGHALERVHEQALRSQKVGHGGLRPAQRQQRAPRADVAAQRLFVQTGGARDRDLFLEELERVGRPPALERPAAEDAAAPARGQRVRARARSSRAAPRSGRRSRRRACRARRRARRCRRPVAGADRGRRARRLRPPGPRRAHDRRRGPRRWLRASINASARLIAVVARLQGSVLAESLSRIETASSARPMDVNRRATSSEAWSAIFWLPSRSKSCAALR